MKLLLLTLALAACASAQVTTPEDELVELILSVHPPGTRMPTMRQMLGRAPSEIDPADKIDPRLKQQLDSGQDSIEIAVLTETSAAREAAEELLELSGSPAYRSALWMSFATASPETIHKLSELEGVVAVSASLSIPEKTFTSMERRVRAEISSEQGWIGRSLAAYAIYVVLRTVAKVWAVTMNRSYAGWLEKIPPCPRKARKEDTTFTDCRGFSWDQSNFGISVYHRGAAFSVRSAEPTYVTYQTRLGEQTIGHGQQCNYDEDGDLLTSGTGAGTPDFYSPSNWTGKVMHQFTDVLPWWLLGDVEYKRYWIPDPGQNCP